VSAQVRKAVTSGQFRLDGGSWDVDNNVWLVGDDSEVVVIDAPHDAPTILAAVDGRTVRAIVLTHGHNDHLNAAVALRSATGAPIWFPAADTMLWEAEHGDGPDAPRPDHDLVDGDVITVAGTRLEAIATPGHSPGSTCLYAAELGVLFSGDTLFAGGPGATGRSYSDFDTIVDSITERLLTLPPETVVHTGHGDDTTIGAEAPHRQEWIDRGH